MWDVWISADPAAGQAVLERGVPVRVLALVPVLLHRRAPADPGQDARHVDMIWPLWNLFDFTPEGRGKDWHPKLFYP